MTDLMNRRIAIAAIGLGGIGVAARKPSPAAEPPGGTSLDGPSIQGVWTYRSFLNTPEIDTDFRDLEFARATVTVDDAPFGVVRGKIRWTTSAGEEGLALKGAITYGNPFSVRIQGRGDTAGTNGWIYDYVGFLIPTWPDGIDQRPAIVGTVIRTAPHGTRPAGLVASFIMVKRDDP